MAQGRIYWTQAEVNNLVDWWEEHGTETSFDFQDFAEAVGDVLEDTGQAGRYRFAHTPTYRHDAKGYTVHYSGLLVPAEGEDQEKEAVEDEDQEKEAIENTDEEETLPESGPEEPLDEEDES